MEIFGNIWISFFLFLLSIGLNITMNVRLYTGKIKNKKIAWLLYFLSLLFPAIVWLEIFFSDVLYQPPPVLNIFESNKLILAKVVIASFFGFAFSKLIWLEWRLGCGINLFFSKVAKVMTFVFLIVVFSVTLYSIELSIKNALKEELYLDDGLGYKMETEQNRDSEVIRPR
jgi:hypothetical protein